MAVPEDTLAAIPERVGRLDEIELAQAHATLTRILGAIEEYVYVGEFLPNDSYRVLFAGPCRERFLGMPVEQARTAVWANYVHPSDMDLFDAAHEGAHTTGRLDAEYRLVGADGRVRWVRDRGQLRTEDGRRLLDGSVLDVTAIKSTQDALEVARAEAHHASQTDPLTGVWNRRSLVAQMTALGDGPVGVLMVDIDHFKNINDLFGHAAGDAVLIAVAARLGQTTRANDAIFRMGGEEFLLVLPGLFDDTALHDVAEGVCRRIGREPVTVSGERIQPTASIGAARCDSLSSNIDTLLRAADRALYAAKRAGRDRVWLASDDTEAADAPVADSATLRLAKAMAIVGADPDGMLDAHLTDVSQLAARVARRLSCPPQQVLRCRLAGLLHEIGKLQVLATMQSTPEDVRGKAELMRTHPTVGAPLVARVSDVRPLAPIVRQHHERYDGTGYPDGHAGDDIPLEARIIAATNMWSAMTSSRPQRAALTLDEARRELDRVTGTKLDPLVVAALQSVLGHPRDADPA
jgi:diguanylate cyclase (GGDEF)-like protein